MPSSALRNFSAPHRRHHQRNRLQRIRRLALPPGRRAREAIERPQDHGLDRAARAGRAIGRAALVPSARQARPHHSDQAAGHAGAARAPPGAQRGRPLCSPPRSAFTRSTVQGMAPAARSHQSPPGALHPDRHLYRHAPHGDFAIAMDAQHSRRLCRPGRRRYSQTRSAGRGERQTPPTRADTATACCRTCAAGAARLTARFLVEWNGRRSSTSEPHGTSRVRRPDSTTR
jgi:hypothetical protein